MSKKKSKKKRFISYPQKKDDESNNNFSSSFLKKNSLKENENEMMFYDNDLSSLVDQKEEEKEIFISNNGNNIFEDIISSDEVSNEIISFQEESREFNVNTYDKIINENSNFPKFINDNNDKSDKSKYSNKDIKENNFNNDNNFDILNNKEIKIPLNNSNNINNINLVSNRESHVDNLMNKIGNESFNKNSRINVSSYEKDKTIINYERFLDNRFIDVIILVVDDEKLIRQSNINLIKKHFIDMDVNLLICECEDGFDCLYTIYRFKKKGIEFNYIITDQTMNYICGTVLSDIIKILKINGVIKDINMYMLTSYSSKIIKNNSNFIEIFCKPLKKRHLETMFSHLNEDLEQSEEEENRENNDVEYVEEDENEDELD
jgi:hypothetical protein